MLKKLIAAAIALIFVVAATLMVLLKQEPAPPSQAFINGAILTMDATNTQAEAVLIEQQRIVAVGSNAQIKAQLDSSTVVHDLQGKTLIPGFIDAHGHFPGSGLSESGVDLNSPPIGHTQSIEQLLDTLKEHAANTPKGQWILGIGYDDTLLAEKRHPNREELDQALPDHPVFVWHVSGHMAVANSLALALANISESSTAPKGGVYAKDPDTGKLNGLLEESALNEIQMLAMDFGVLDFYTMVRIASRDYSRVGVTTAQSGAADLQMTQGLMIASQLGLIPMRLQVWPLFDQLGPKLLDGSVDKSQLETGKMQLGAIKIFSDGSIQGYTGYLTQPYHVAPIRDGHASDPEYRGYPRMDKTSLIEWVEKYHGAGFQIAIHANGDAAIDDALAAIEQAQGKHPGTDSRHIIIHAQMTRPDQLDKMKELGVTPSFFVAHTYYWGDRHHDIFMGPTRAAAMSPTATALSKAVPFSIHLDTPVVPMKPLFLVWTAVNRMSSGGRVIGPEQRISALQALRAVTIDAAWQIHQEGNRGSIETGKFADLVVLDGNPLENPIAIKEIPVTMTMVGGRIIFPKIE